MMKSLSEMQSLRERAALELLGMYKRVGAGHIGCSLSCLEILLEVEFNRMSTDDVLILSKGHAAAALYVVHAMTGRLDKKLLETFYQDGTLLAAHPPCNNKIPSIPFGTGSLGHGASLAVGTALATRYTKKQKQVYCVLSDGDCNEGSTWEAIMFAAHHRLENFTMIIDANGVQGIARTSEVLNLEPLASKLSSFGFSVAEAANGNSFQDLRQTFERLEAMKGRPRCLIARTTKGHGVDYMEGTVDWHYLPMNDEQYHKAVEQTKALK